MAFVYMKDKDGQIISVNEDYVKDYEAKGYTTDLSKPLDKSKLSPNSIFREENAHLITEKYKMPNKDTGVPDTVSKSSVQSNIQKEIDKLAELQKQQNIAGLAKVRDTALSNLAAEREQIKPMYYNSRNQANTASQLAARSFAEYMAQRGLTRSGAALQGELNRQGALQNQINALNVAENQAYADIARRMSDVRNAYESDVAAAKAGIQAQALQNQIAEMQRQQDIAREDAKYKEQLDKQDKQNEIDTYLATIGRFANNYQAEINRVQNDGDPSNDWQIPYLQAARQEKIAQAQAQYNKQGIITPDLAPILRLPVGTMLPWYEEELKAAEAKAEQQQFENWLKEEELKLKQKQVNYETNKPYYKPTSTSSSSSTSYKNNPDFAADLQKIYADPVKALQQLQSNAALFIQAYGLDGYNALLKEARASIQE